jgi:hypothetical protein
MLQVSVWAPLSIFESIVLINDFSLTFVELNRLIRPKEALNIFLSVFHLDTSTLRDLSDALFGEDLALLDHDFGHTLALVGYLELH